MEVQAGPFASLPVDCQLAAVTLLYYLAPLGEPLLAAAAAVLALPEVPVAVVDRALELLCHLGDSDAQPVPDAVSFAATVALQSAAYDAADAAADAETAGTGQAEAAAAQQRRSAEVAAAVVERLRLLKAAPALGPLLRPLLLATLPAAGGAGAGAAGEGQLLAGLRLACVWAGEDSAELLGRLARAAALLLAPPEDAPAATQASAAAAAAAVGDAVGAHRRLLGRVAVEVVGLGSGDAGWSAGRCGRALMALAGLPAVAGLARAGHGWRELVDAVAAVERRGGGAAGEGLRTRMETLRAVRDAA